jgi:hypothetical protein
MGMLVDPIPKPVRDKISWEAFVEQVNSVPLEILRHRASNVCDEIEYTPVRNAFRRELEAAELDGDLAEGLILAALKLGILNAYAYLPQASSCFALNSFYWHTFSRRHADRALQTGSASLPITDLVPQSIESDVANRPLFVTADAVKDLLNLRPPSNAALERLATKIISDHQASTTRKLRKRDFVARLMRLSPGCSKNRAQAAWTNHAPPAWRRPGRPPHT